MTDYETSATNEPQIVNVTITAPDSEWLRQHCAMLVEQRLAASANIIPAIDSIYRWQGQVHYATEAFAILQTQTERIPEVTRQTIEAHPYETAHILVSQVQVPNASYEAWILDNTSPAI